MHKKLEAELIHLAHQILKINKQTDISELRDKARVIYENLSVLSFVDDYFVETPDVTDSKDNFLEELNSLSSKKSIHKRIEEDTKIAEEVIVEIPKEVEKPQEEINVEVEKEETEQLVQQTVKTIKSEAKEIVTKIQETPKTPIVEENNSLAEEMKHSIPADVAADMFEKAESFIPKAKKVDIPKETETFSAFAPNRKADIESIDIVEEKKELPKKVVVPETPTEVEKPKVNVATKQEIPESKPTSTATSLNDRISNQKIQVGLNDRIAFVKHLFNFSQEDFNRVLSQLNTLTSEFECKDFIENKVKPDYNWVGKEDYEARLITLVERKFK